MDGYRFQTTFWMDFTIADAFGEDAVKDTFKRAFEEWRDNYIYLTELVIVMNMKCWYWYDKGNHSLSHIYSDYYYQAKDYACDHLDEDEFEYFFQMTD